MVRSENVNNNTPQSDNKTIQEFMEVMKNFMISMTEVKKPAEIDNHEKWVTAVSRGVRKFDGNSEGDKFLSTFEAYYMTLGAPESSKSRCFCSCLSDEAATWLLYQANLQEKNWEEVKLAFRKQFCDE